MVMDETVLVVDTEGNPSSCGSYCSTIGVE